MWLDGGKVRERSVSDEIDRVTEAIRSNRKAAGELRQAAGPDKTRFVELDHGSKEKHA